MNRLGLHRRLLFSAALLLLGGALVLHPDVYWQVVGWWRAEARYQGKPTSYWAAEASQWDEVDLTGLAQAHRLWLRRDSWWDRYIGRRQPSDLPPLVAGDAAALPVLQELLRAEGDARVRTMAIEGLGRIGPLAKPAVPTLLALITSAPDDENNWPAQAWSALQDIDPEATRRILVRPPGAEPLDMLFPPP